MAEAARNEPLPTVEEFRAKVEGLTYAGRQEYAVEIAKSNLEGMPSFIEALRNSYDPPTVASIEVDETLTDLLPTQSMNVSKNFHVHQLTLIMASTAKLKDVLREEVQAPTRMFKKYAVKQWVRLEKDAAALAEVSGRAVPAVQRMLINQLLLQRETEALDLLAERHSEKLPDVLASYLHGCSIGVVRKALENPRIIKSKSLRGLLGKFHWELILERLEAKVNKEYEADYSGWNNINEEFQYAKDPIWEHLKKNSKFTARLWDLLFQYPQSKPRATVEYPYTQIKFATWKHGDPLNVWTLPYSLNIPEMTQRHPEKWLEYWSHNCRFQILPNSLLKCDTNFDTILKNMKKKDRFKTLKWFMEKYMPKDVVFPELCQLPLAKIYDPSWRGKTTGRGKQNPIGGVLFCVNKAQTFDQIGSGLLSCLAHFQPQVVFDNLVNTYEEQSPGKTLEITNYMLQYYDTIQPSQKPEELMVWLHWLKHQERFCTQWSKKLIARGEKLKRKKEDVKENPWMSSIDLLEAKADGVVDALLAHPWRLGMESRVRKLCDVHEKVTATLDFWKELVKQNQGYRATQAQEAVANKLKSMLKMLDVYYTNKFGEKHPIKTHPLDSNQRGRSGDGIYLASAFQSAISSLQNHPKQASDEGLVDRLNAIWDEWSAKFEGMDLTFEKVVGKQKKRTLMKQMLEKFQKQIEAYVFAEIRASQNYDIILKDFAYRRFARAKQEVKPEVTARTWKVYMFMMPPALGKDCTKFDEYLYGMRKERWMHLVNNFVTGVFRYSMKKNRTTKPYGYDLYHSITSEVMKVWTATDRSKCFCSHAADAYIGILTALYQSRELPKDGDEKDYVPVEKVVSITEEWLALVLGLEPTDKEAIEENWYEWRNWIITIVDKITFVLFGKLKSKQDKLKSTRQILESEKAILREDIEYQTKLGHRLYQVLLKLHVEHGVRFEEETYNRLVPFCKKVMAFEESIQIDYHLRNERWMTKSVKVVEKIHNLMGKKAWSKNPLNSDGLVDDLEVAWGRMNQRLIDVLKEKEFRERKLAAKERGEEFNEVEDTKQETKMAQFFEAFKRAGQVTFSQLEAKERAAPVGVDVDKLVENAYTFRELFTVFKEDLEDEEEGLAKETPTLPPVSNKTAVQMQKMKSAAEYCLTQLKMFFDSRRSTVVQALVTKMHSVPEEFLPVLYTDFYETIYPLYNKEFDTLDLYYETAIRSMLGVLISKESDACKALYRKFLVEGYFQYNLKKYEELDPDEDERERNAICEDLFNQLHHCKREMARELYDMIVDKEQYESLFVLMRDYYYKDTEFFRELFEEFLKFRRRRGDDFEQKCKAIMRQIEDPKLKEEIFLNVVGVKRMVKVCVNSQSLVLDLLKQGISCYNSKAGDDTYTAAMRDRVTEVIVALVEANKNDEGLKEKLDPLVDVTNNKIRRVLTKSADSSSAQQRVDVLERLAKATDSVHAAFREKELARTLGFVGKKLKNESLDNRTSGLSKVFAAISDVSMNLMLKNEKCRDVLLEMLQDSLDSVSLDETSIQADWEKKFRLFSRRAFKLGGQDLESGLVDFGFEIQWRIMKHRLGEKPCAKQFLVNFGHLLKRHERLANRRELVERETREGKQQGRTEEEIQSRIKERFNSVAKYDIYFPEENEEGFILQVMEAYRVRKEEIYPDWLSTCVDEATHLLPVFRVLGQNWKNSDRMQKFLSTIMDTFLDMKFQWDDPDDSELIAPELEVTTAKVLKEIVSLHPEDWFKIKEFDAFVNSVFGAVHELHVRGKDRCLQASQMLILWMLRYSLKWAIGKYNLRVEGEDIFAEVPLGEEWTTQPLMKTVIERCLEILQPKYPKNGPCFWSLEFEIHLAFRWALTNIDKVDKTKLAKAETVDLLPSLKIPLFVSYWKTLEDNMGTVLKEGAPAALVKNTITVNGFKYIRVTDDDEKTLFDDEDEEKHYRTESIVWALDVLNQYCLGGSSHNLRFVYRRPTFLEIKGLPKENILSQISAPKDPRCDWRWLEVENLKTIADMSLQLLETGWETDADGLAIVPENHFVATFYNRVIYLFHNPNCSAAKGEKNGYVHWDNHEVLKRFVEVFLKTRTCVKFVWKMYSHFVDDKNGKERWEARNKFVELLLDISPSSIYIPLVWRHLVLHRQDLLSTYLSDLSRPYFGLFYLPSQTRPKTRFRLKEEASNPGASSMYSKSVSSDWSNCIKRIPLEEEALKAFEQDLEEWTAEKHDPDDRYDNREIWSFPACYKLTRLTPDMAQKIYEQKLAEAKNKSRSMGERVSSIQRLTLLPSVDLADVVSLIDAEDADWTTNILERLVRGAVYVDEITYGAHYILQPKLLSAQMARVAGFCLDPVLRYIQRDSFTKLMRLILSGDRRKKMKVTVYKQMIRILLKRINSKHVRMFKFEWGRGEVHRDVRVVIIKIALEMLRSDNPPDYVLKTAWHILESTVWKKDMSHQQELMTVVFGASGLEKSIPANLLTNPKLGKLFEELTSEAISTKYWSRFVRRILLPSCERLHGGAARKERGNCRVIVPVAGAAAMDADMEKPVDIVKKKADADEEEWDMLEDSDDEFSVHSVSSDCGSTELAIMPETDCKGNMWKWPATIDNAAPIFCKKPQLAYLCIDSSDAEAELVVCGSRDDAAQWIDVNGYICTKDCKKYMALTADGRLCVKPWEENLPLHPQICFRSDGAIMIDSHQPYMRSMDDLAFISLRLGYRYLLNSAAKEFDEQVRLRLARMAFEVLSDMTLDFIYPDKRAWVTQVNARRSLALDVLKKCVAPEGCTYWTQKEIDQRWMHFFRRGLDIAHNTLTTTDISPIRTTLVTQIPAVYNIENGFDSKVYLDQCMESFFLMDYTKMVSMYSNWLTLRSNRISQRGVQLDKAMDLLKNAYDFMGWQMSQLSLRTSVTSVGDTYQQALNPIFNNRSVHAPTLKALVIDLLNAFFNDTLPVSEDIKAMKSYKTIMNTKRKSVLKWVISKLSTMRNSEYSASYGIPPVLPETIDIHWDFLNTLAKGNEYDWNLFCFHQTHKLAASQNELLVRVMDKIFSMFDRYRPEQDSRNNELYDIKKKESKEEAYWFNALKGYYRNCSLLVKFLFSHPEYINKLLLSSFCFSEGINDSNFIELWRNLTSMQTQTKPSGNQFQVFIYGVYYGLVGADHPIWNFKEIFLKSILEEGAGDRYCFEGLSKKLMNSSMRNLIDCDMFQENLPAIYELCVNGKVRSGKKKYANLEAESLGLIKGLNDSRGYEAWPEMEKLIASLINRAIGPDATLYDQKLANRLIGTFPMMIWNQNADMFERISKFLVSSAQAMIEDEERKRQEALDSQASLLARERAKADADSAKKNLIDTICRSELFFYFFAFTHQHTIVETETVDLSGAKSKSTITHVREETRVEIRNTSTVTEKRDPTKATPEEEIPKIELYDIPSLTVSAAKRIVDCIVVPLEDHEVKELPDASKVIVSQLVENMLQTKIVNWKDASLEEINAAVPGLYIFLCKTHIFQQVYGDNVDKTLEVFQFVIDMLIKAPFRINRRAFSFEALIRIVGELVGHTEHCDSYNDCYTPLIRLLLKKMNEEVQDPTNYRPSASSNFTELWFKICQSNAAMLGEFFFENHTEALGIFDQMYKVANSVYTLKDVPRRTMNGMRGTFISFMEGIIESRYSNWEITRVLGRVVPTMLKLLVNKAIEETSDVYISKKKYLAFDLIEDICQNRKLSATAIAICAGAELTGDLCLGMLLQKKNQNCKEVCKKLIDGIHMATHEKVPIGPEPKEEGADREEDVILHKDEVAVVVRLLGAVEENMQAAYRDRCISCLDRAVTRTRWWGSKVVHLYLEQYEDVYMRLFKIWFDRRYDLGRKAKSEVSTLKDSVWNLTNGSIRNPRECKIITDKLLHYLKLISSFDVNNIEESDAMATIQLDLIDHIGYITAGVTELYEPGPIDPASLEVGGSVFVGYEDSVVEEVPLNLGEEYLGEEVVISSVDVDKGEATVYMQPDSEEEEKVMQKISIEHLRKPIDQTSSGEAKFEWNVEFVDMLKEYFTNDNPDVRLKAFAIPTAYGSKSEWSSLRSISSKIKQKNKKKKGKRKKN